MNIHPIDIIIIQIKESRHLFIYRSTLYTGTTTVNSLFISIQTYLRLAQ